MPSFRRTKPNHNEELKPKSGRLHRVHRGLDEARERLKPRSDKGKVQLGHTLRRSIKDVYGKPRRRRKR